MTARDELAALLRDAALTAIAGLPVLTFEGYADAIIAAGWRPPPLVLTDPAELADVPAGSVVQDALGVLRQLIDGEWVATTTAAVASAALPLPAMIIKVGGPAG
jgi:hypothetical protein